MSNMKTQTIAKTGLVVSCPGRRNTHGAYCLLHADSVTRFLVELPENGRQSFRAAIHQAAPTLLWAAGPSCGFDSSVFA